MKEFNSMEVFMKGFQTKLFDLERKPNFSGTKRAAYFVLALAIILGLGTINRAAADGLPNTKPEQVGFSSAKLGLIGQVIKDDVAKGVIPGAVVLVARHGKVAYFESLGFLNADAKTPMVKDGIFRIYSMSKPVAQVAAMMLVEEGKISLDDPISKYLPQFSKMEVGKAKKTAKGFGPLKLVPAKRPITIRDLMRHTSGITYGFFGADPVRAAYNEPRFFRDFDVTNAELADEIAKLPLAYQPGTTWDYSHSTDILARIIEVVSGKTLYQFEKEQILDPLGMKDTSFYVTDKDKQKHIAEALKDDQVMAVDPLVKEANGAPFLYVLSNPRIPHKWESAGSGMVSTAMDYGCFLQMLLNKGSLERKQYLKPESIADMTTDQISQGITPGPIYLPGPGYGFGLGFAVRREGNTAPDPGTPGDYFWFGAGGTSFWVDPQKDLFVVFMMQSPKQVLKYRSLVRKMVYEALTN
jgi:CubicO group peptidase (beta-lactamase class C family)